MIQTNKQLNKNLKIIIQCSFLLFFNFCGNIDLLSQEKIEYIELIGCKFLEDKKYVDKNLLDSLESQIMLHTNYEVEKETFIANSNNYIPDKKYINNLKILYNNFHFQAYPTFVICELFFDNYEGILFVSSNHFALNSIQLDSFEVKMIVEGYKNFRDLGNYNIQYSSSSHFSGLFVDMIIHYDKLGAEKVKRYIRNIEDINWSCDNINNYHYNKIVNIKSVNHLLKKKIREILCR